MIADFENIPKAYNRVLDNGFDAVIDTGIDGLTPCPQIEVL